MGMDVDESGRDPESFDIDSLESIRSVEVLTDGGDFAVLDAYVTGPVDMILGIDYMSTLKEEIIRQGVGRKCKPARATSLRNRKRTEEGATENPVPITLIFIRYRG
jgi:hypothetical protein